MPGDEVGVEMGEEHVRDAQPVLGGNAKVLIDVALRIDDGRGARLLVADEIRRVRQAIQIELVQDHTLGVSGQVYERSGPSKRQSLKRCRAGRGLSRSSDVVRQDSARLADGTMIVKDGVTRAAPLSSRARRPRTSDTASAA